MPFAPSSDGLVDGLLACLDLFKSFCPNIMTFPVMVLESIVRLWLLVLCIYSETLGQIP